MSGIRYDKLVARAHRDILRQVLAGMSLGNVSQEQSFRIRFPLNYPGVVRPLGPLFDDYWKDENNEITIAIEGVFYDLAVTQTEFSVTLFFHDRNCYRITVPFNAVTGFYDMTAEFGFQIPAEYPDVHDNVVPFKRPA
jgi:hypothetical protein